MENVMMPSRSSWYGQGLRWIGSLFVGAGDWLDQPSSTPGPLELIPDADFMPPEENVFELRHRIQARSDLFR
jgi:hypothetical protein